MKIGAAIIIVLGLASLLSCEKDTDNVAVAPKTEQVARSEKNVSERFLRIDGQADTLRNYELGRNLFGKFFNQRAEFYIIEDPNKTLYNRPVKSITLYFLDGTLAKTRYELDEDITDELIRSYGTFTIKGFDTLTRKLFKTEKIVLTDDGEKKLNKKLTNYELKWDLDSKFVYTRVDKRSTRKRYEYIEALKQYSSKFKHIEGLN